MIFFIHKTGFDFTFEGVKKDPGAPPVTLQTYSSLLSRHHIPRGTYILVDRERLDPWELKIYGALYKHLQNSGPGYRVLNNPARIRNRYELLRVLYLENINRFNVYLVPERKMPERYPVFIRRIHDHRAPLSGLLKNRHELEKALQDLYKQNEPEEGLMITEFHAEPVKDNLYRKHSSFRVGNNVFFYHTMIDETWLVKSGMKKPYPEELCRDDLEKVESNAFENELRRAFDLANIEYGRADFSIVNGEVQIYEINTNPHLMPLKKMKLKNPLRNRSITMARKKYIDALLELDNTKPGATLAPVFRHPDLMTETCGFFRKRRVIKRN